ncbi:MAG: beta-ketoacyl synthase [Pseudanabaena sp.]|nr:MAG: beta-ketoacyl synthase [Pseudanabaena sp.]
MDDQISQDRLQGIAVIGMAGKFPKANDIAQFWQNLRNGVDGITFFSDEELLAEGVNPEIFNQPNYVKAGAVLADIDQFDAQFFGYSPKEAELIDPQQRLFLECAWQALENAGYSTNSGKEKIGVYAGANWSTYLLYNLSLNPNLFAEGGWSAGIGNSRDFLATRVSYQLNLNGPSLNISTACSTSLVSVHLACRDLLSYQCDIALAGGVSIRTPHQTGYAYQSGDIFSSDGYCRPFDAKADGTIFGNAVGIVALKRLEEAVADGDYIYAVIKGSAINNDGSLKVGYTAPSVSGQAEVIAEAQAIAGVSPETISYIEAHGTGTNLGDPIEIRALTQAFQEQTTKKRFCAIGSVKSNFGHVDAASGVTGLIKTVLSLHHRQIPATLHLEQPNPDIDFANSPFYVNTTLRDWQGSGTHPLRAGVSSFGIGGTNAHVILEEAPLIENSDRTDSDQLLLLSAKTETALEAIAQNLATHLQQNREFNLADVAYTLSLGRHHFEHRRMLVCRDVDEAIATLTSPTNSIHIKSDRQASVVFMFSGQGSQYIGMARELYEHVPVFREHLDRCCELLNPLLGCDLRQILYPPQAQISEMQDRLQQTAIAQPAIFAIAYALSQTWLAWGIKPIAMIGHSIGEYVAACLAGVFTLEDAINLVAIRGRLMQQLPAGAMLSVSLSEAEIQPLLEKDVAIAAINAPNLIVVSGTFEDITSLEQQLTVRSIDCRRLHTSHAFHSAMMEPMFAEFQHHLAKVRLNPPQIPYVSNVSGDWITPNEAINPAYWVKHIRQTVRFSEGIQQLFHNPSQILLEVGAGKTLSTLVHRHSDKPSTQIVINSVRHPQEQSSDFTHLSNTLGQLWLGGISVDWSAFYSYLWRHRLPLPTYPFERQRFWISAPSQANTTTTSAITEQRLSFDSWFYTPVWKSAIPNSPKSKKLEQGFWLVFLDESPWSDLLLQKLRQAQQNLIVVTSGDAEFTRSELNSYSINPNSASAYGSLLDDLMQSDRHPSRILHFWNVTSVKKNIEPEVALDATLENTLAKGFYSLLYLAQALGKYTWEQGLQVSVISNQIQAVTEDESLQPAKATVLGACKVIPKEYPKIQCQSIDIVLPVNNEQSANHDRWIDQLLAELAEPIKAPIVAYRGNRRWLPVYEPVQLAKQLDTSRLKQGGVYLITGGLGGLGLVLAEHLAKTLQAKLLLIGRSAIPERSQWTNWLETHAIDDRTGQQILKLQELEASGAEVFVIAADVTNLSQMQVAIAKAEQQWGQIHGVFHTAGVAGGGVIQQKSSSEVTKVMAPKIQGTLVLEKIFQDKPLDFFVLYSSLTSVLGAFGQVDYCAANAFLDAYTYAHKLKKTKFVTSINWNAWRDVGMAANTKSSSAKFQALQQESLKYAIAPSEGLEALTRILGSTLSQAIVTPQPLESLWEQTSTLTELLPSDSTYESTANSPLYPRPRLNSIYVAPSNDTEKAIALIWQKLLRIDKVGINDNFFELGGDSLLGVQLTAHLNKELNTQVAAHILYQAPTVSSIAEIIAPSPSDQDTAVKVPSRGDLRRARKMQRP